VKQDLKVGSDDPIFMLVGLDVHRNYLQEAVVDTEGTVLKEARIPNGLYETKRFFADIDHGKWCGPLQNENA
jgi:predicted NBD/HSP70 family sugar kinase